MIKFSKKEIVLAQPAQRSQSYDFADEDNSATAASEYYKDPDFSDTAE